MRKVKEKITHVEGKVERKNVLKKKVDLCKKKVKNGEEKVMNVNEIGERFMGKKRKKKEREVH